MIAQTLDAHGAMLLSSTLREAGRLSLRDRQGLAPSFSSID